MPDNYTDKFSEATNELQEKSGFICESCKKTYSRDNAVKQDMTCCNRTMKELVQQSFGP
jgi:transcription initiation factor IIE alpha subunit